MPNTYDIGDVVRCQAVFTDVNGAAFDPTTVTAKYQDPAGNETTLVYLTDVEVIKSATGTYYVDVPIDERGAWFYRFEGLDGSGDEQGAGEEKFLVRKSEF